MNNDVSRAVTQTLRTHLFAAGLRDHFILFADNVNPLSTCQMILLHHRETFSSKRSFGAFAVVV
ncbi:Uncharacterised protein [Enterobacter cloacae]|nr:Uncharacterised protein [Enterobacter cloacae]